MNDTTAFHGDPGHSCYDHDGQLTCVVGKMLVNDGPGWRELAGLQAPYEGQARLGRIVLGAATAATHDLENFDADNRPHIERLNHIMVGEAFASALADAGCMIVRIPEEHR